MRLAFGVWRLAFGVRRSAFPLLPASDFRPITDHQSPLTCFRVPGAHRVVGVTGVIPPTSQLLRATAFLRPRSP